MAQAGPSCALRAPLTEDAIRRLAYTTSIIAPEDRRTLRLYGSELHRRGEPLDLNEARAASDRHARKWGA